MIDLAELEKLAREAAERIVAAYDRCRDSEGSSYHADAWMDFREIAARDSAPLARAYLALIADHRALSALLTRAETMLRAHANWSDGVYVRRPEDGRDEDLVMVSLPNKVRIIDLADDCRDALRAEAAAPRQSVTR